MYEHIHGASEILGGKLMISLRPEADDCTGAHFWALCLVKVSVM